ncbi:HNH endonuclease [Sphingomonas sp. ABOLE]|nr:HNH endonuclease [Sphingomonas sp. ABOLE]
MLIDHEANGEEIILFYRDRVRQYDGAGFRYEGRFAYVSHEGGKPASFVFKRYSERSTDRLIEKQIDFDPGSVEDAREATLGAIRRRQGQAKFRADLMDAYDGRCAVTGCQYAPLLEAAHIHPYRGRETNHVSNGLLLRADIHTLFDLGLIAVFPDGALDICPTLAATEYASLSRLMFPKKVAARPSDKALAWHRREVATKEARAALSAKLKAL